MIYFDSSALVKRYTEEIGTDFVKSIILDSAEIATSKLTYPEILSALMRRYPAGEIARKPLMNIIDRFEKDWGHVLVLEFHNDLLPIVKILIEKHPLKEADAIHLSSALWLRHCQTPRSDLKRNPRIKKRECGLCWHGHGVSSRFRTHVVQFMNGTATCFLALGLLPTVVIFLAGFLTQPWHHINEAWVAMLCFLILFASSVLDEKTVRADIDWNFLISFGVLVGFGNIISGSGLSGINAGGAKPYLEVFVGNKWIFLLVITLASWVAGYHPVYLAPHFRPGDKSLCNRVSGIGLWQPLVFSISELDVPEPLRKYGRKVVRP